MKFNLTKNGTKVGTVTESVTLYQFVTKIFNDISVVTGYVTNLKKESLCVRMCARMCACARTRIIIIIIYCNFYLFIRAKPHQY